jgi:adenosine deaminase
MRDEPDTGRPALERADSPETSAAFRAALERADLSAIRKIPKADLHVHGCAGGRMPRYRDWSGMDLPEAPESFPDFADFDHYLLVSLGAPYIGKGDARTLECMHFMLADALRAAIEEGVVILEPSVDCTFLSLYGDDPERMVDDVRRVIADTLASAGNPPIEVRPELGMARGVPLDFVGSAVPRLIKTGFFRSVDLYGDERVGATADYVPFFRLAGELGLRRKAHAGELCPASSVRESVDALGLDAVQHGIAAADDPSLMEYLARKGIVLNVCPTSNVRLCRAPSLARHPLRRLIDAGVACTVNSDDLIVFDSSVAEEFLKLWQTGVFTAEELDRLRLTGLR